VTSTDDRSGASVHIFGPETTTIYAGTVTIDASHESRYENDADTHEAAAIGGSGATATASVHSPVSTTLDSGVLITAQDVSITAEDMFIDGGENDINNGTAAGNTVTSGAGGVVTGNA